MSGMEARPPSSDDKKIMIMTLRRSPRDRRRRYIAKMRSIVAATARNAACFVLGSGDPRFDHRLPGFAVQHGLVALRDLDRGEPVAYMRGAHATTSTWHRRVACDAKLRRDMAVEIAGGGLCVVNWHFDDVKKKTRAENQWYVQNTDEDEANVAVRRELYDAAAVVLVWRARKTVRAGTELVYQYDRLMPAECVRAWQKGQKGQKDQKGQKRRCVRRVRAKSRRRRGTTLGRPVENVSHR